MSVVATAGVTAGVEQPALSVRAVTKRFGTTVALDGVDLDLAAGTIHGLLGPNGAGKTTLLRMIFGLVRPDTGSVHVLGRSPFGAPGAALHGLAGFVEAPTFYPYLSAARNLDLLAALDGLDRAGAAQRVDAALEAVGLAGRSRAKVSGFSTGMTQRLGVAAALLRDPDLLVLDEPTNGLDPTGLRTLHDLLRRRAADGRAVLLSSHDMAEVEELCDDVTILRRGEVVYSGGLEALRETAPAPTYLVGTSDDVRAAALAATVPGVETALPADGEPGLLVHAAPGAMDGFVMALGRSGVAVRRLSRRDTALETLFLRLTADPEPQR